MHRVADLRIFMPRVANLLGFMQLRLKRQKVEASVYL